MTPPTIVATSTPVILTPPAKIDYTQTAGPAEIAYLAQQAQAGTPVYTPGDFRPGYVIPEGPFGPSPELAAIQANPNVEERIIQLQAYHQTLKLGF